MKKPWPAKRKRKRLGAKVTQEECEEEEPEE